MVRQRNQQVYVPVLRMEVKDTTSWIAKSYFDTEREARAYCERAMEIPEVQNAVIYRYSQGNQQCYVEAIYGNKWDNACGSQYQWASHQVMIVLRTAVTEGTVNPNFAYCSARFREFLEYRSPFDWDMCDCILALED